MLIIMAKPKRLLYPTNLIDREVARLQVALRRLYRQYKRREIGKVQCLVAGEDSINKAFSKAEQDIKTYLTKHGLSYGGDRSELDDCLQSTLAGWRRLVDRF
jgi:sulfite reductase alpha subunit-like flavoprotein